MQTWDVVKGLHNFPELSQLPKYLGEAMLTQKKASIA